MNAKEAVIISRYETAPVSVRFGYGPFKKEDIDFLMEKRPPYLSLAVLETWGEVKMKVVLGDVRLHEELRQAVEKDIGKQDYYEFGQVDIRGNLIRGITFHHAEDYSDERTMDLIKPVISAFDPDPSVLESKGVVFTYAATFGERFIYYPLLKRIVKRAPKEI